MAWGASGGFHETEEMWDLWMIWSDIPDGYEKLPLSENRTGRPSEYRVYHQIPKSKIWYVGSRMSTRPAMIGEQV